MQFGTWSWSLSITISRQVCIDEKRGEGACHMALFMNRADAGKKLSEKLIKYARREDVAILALPRGGVPVAFEVARRLRAPLDIFLVRKLGLPGQEELAMGAIASGGIRVLNEDVVNRLGVPDDVLNSVTTKEMAELERRERAYRGDAPMIEVSDRTVILIDDGLATGASMKAAVSGLWSRDPDRLVVAVPVAAPDVCARFQQLVDEIICLETPEMFFGVGAWYDDFAQVIDEDVRQLLQRANALSSSDEE
jgi:putative phosphoribosyl transferase